MKLNNMRDIYLFLATLEKLKGEVYVEDMYHTRFELKTEFDRYVAIGLFAGIDGGMCHLVAEKDNMEDWHEIYLLGQQLSK